MAWLRINRIAEHEEFDKSSKTFIDDKTKPIQTIEEPAEKYRFDTQRETCPHCGPATGLAEPQ